MNPFETLAGIYALQINVINNIIPPSNLEITQTATSLIQKHQISLKTIELGNTSQMKIRKYHLSEGRSSSVKTVEDVKH